MRCIRSACLAVLLPALAVCGERPLRLSDIVEQLEPSSPRISPDGKAVAFLVRRASLATDSYSTELDVVMPGSAPQRILEESSIARIEWTPDGGSITAVLPRPGRAALWRVPMDMNLPAACGGSR
ncbi:MAG: hypothetical protein HXY20_02560 [Acidobacteria bacterium]|nr:hypothetical protein [Acidobacteriota bacterium]